MTCFCRGRTGMVIYMNYLDLPFTLRISECDLHNAWRPGAVLTELQEAATLHSASLGCSREELLRSGVAWVVARMELRMARYPVSGEALTIRTFHRPVRHRFFPRFFVITDGAGQVIGQASSLWLLMDLETRQSVSADRLPHALPDNSDMPEPIPLPGSVPALDSQETVIPWEALYTDLDPNGHVNNTRYADWLCNALGMETMASRQLQRLIIHFNSEVLPAQPLSLRLRREAEQVQLIGWHGEKAAFEIGAWLMPCPVR